MHLFQMTSDYIPLLFSSLADSTSNANANVIDRDRVRVRVRFFEESGDDH